MLLLCCGLPCLLNAQALRSDLQNDGWHFTAGKASILLPPDFYHIVFGNRKPDYRLGTYDFHHDRMYARPWQGPRQMDCSDAGGCICQSLDESGTVSQDFRLHVTQPGPDEIQFLFTLHPKTPDAWAEMHLCVPPDLPLYGLGMQFTHTTLNGQAFSLISEEQGIGRGEAGTRWQGKLSGVGGNAETTYLPAPVIIMPDGRALLLEHPGPLYLDFRQAGRIRIRFRQGWLQGRILAAGSIPALMEAVTAHTGRPQPLPDWAWGTWLGVQGGEARVSGIVAQAQAQHIPLAAVWIQDWTGRKKTRYGDRLRWFWEPDTLLYPDLNGFCTRMRAQGIRVLGYVNPFLMPGGKYFQEAAAHGFLVKQRNGKPYLIPVGGFRAGMMDLLNPACRAWAEELIYRELPGRGFSGWMADFGEWLPPDAVLHGSANSVDVHHLYIQFWQEIQARVAARAGAETLFFVRSGWSGTGGTAPVIWAGDQLQGWGPCDGLASLPRAFLSAGVSGFPVVHTDIGGYTVTPGVMGGYRRDAALLQRWTELAAFTPVFRTHEGLRPADVAQVYDSPVSWQAFSRMARLHDALLPLWKAAGKEAAEKGWPMLRPLWMLYPQQTEARALDAQWLVGSDLVFAPVLSPDAQTVRIWIPPGTWRHLLRAQELRGPAWHTVEAPPGMPAAFLRADSPFAQPILSALTDLPPQP